MTDSKKRGPYPRSLAKKLAKLLGLDAQTEAILSEAIFLGTFNSKKLSESLLRRHDLRLGPKVVYRHLELLSKRGLVQCEGLVSPYVWLCLSPKELVGLCEAPQKKAERGEKGTLDPNTEALRDTIKRLAHRKSNPITVWLEELYERRTGKPSGLV